MREKGSTPSLDSTGPGRTSPTHSTSNINMSSEAMVLLPNEALQSPTAESPPNAVPDAGADDKLLSESAGCSSLATDDHSSGPSHSISISDVASDPTSTVVLPKEAALPTDANDSLQSVTISEALETKQERIMRKRSHIIVYITSFIMSMGFSIVITSVWPYLRQLDPSASKIFYGLVIGINPLGQLLASPLLGLWGTRLGSSRIPFVVSISVFVLGNVLYALLRLMRSSMTSTFLMLARFTVGAGAANIAVCRSYVAASTTVAERIPVLTYVSAFQSAGFIFGPAIQTGLAMAIPAPKGIAGVAAEPITGVWDLYTAAGWIAAVMGLINLVFFLPCLYQEVHISTREAQLTQQRVSNVSAKYPKPDYLAVVVLLVNYFFILFVYVLLESIIVPMGRDLYAWSSEFAIRTVGIGLSVVGVLAFFVFFLSSELTKRFDERKVYIFGGLVPLVIAMLIHIPMGHNYPHMQNCSMNATDITTDYPLTFSTSSLPVSVSDNTNTSVLLRSKRSDTMADSYYEPRRMASYFDTLSRTKRSAILDSEGDCDAVGCPKSQNWCTYTPIIEIPQLVVANVFGVIGYPMAFNLATGMFSKIVGPGNPGLWMGIMTSIGSLSRMTGPIFVTWIYSSYGTRWTFGVLSVLLALTLVSASVFYKRFVPMNVNKNIPETECMTQTNGSV